MVGEYQQAQNWQLLWLPLGKVCLVVGELRDPLPKGLVGCAEQPENLENLVNLRVAWEERVTSHHFRNDGANGPHVNWA